MGVELILDGILSIFMAILIVYCIMLNTRLKKFRGAQQEMAQMVAQLNEATAHAQHSITALKQSLGGEEERLADLLKKARTMADELSVITDVGANLADRIEKGLVPGPSKNETAAEVEEPEEVEEVDELRESLRHIR